MVRSDLGNSDNIRTILADCLRELSSMKCPAEFGDDTDILHECNLDSQHGIELACELDARLAIGIPAKDNPLIEDGGATGRKRARKFGEVVRYLEQLASEQTGR
jgi:hypothetical protein